MIEFAETMLRPVLWHMHGKHWRHYSITLYAGMTAAIVDETLGGLNYVLKREGIVPHGPSFTVHLEVVSYPMQHKKAWTFP